LQTKLPHAFATLIVLTAATLSTPPASAKSVGECLVEPDSQHTEHLGMTFNSLWEGQTGTLSCDAGNYIQLDCKGMDNESTIDKITAQFFDADGTRLSVGDAFTVGNNTLRITPFTFSPGYLKLHAWAWGVPHMMPPGSLRPGPILERRACT